MSEFHERLKKARVAARFAGAAEAARAMGVPYPTYAGHENGSRGSIRPKAATIRKYAKRFGVNYAWLADGQGPMKGAEDAIMLGELAPEQAQVLKDLYNQFRRQSR